MAGMVELQMEGQEQVLTPETKVKSLITGPGFVASHLADYLLEKGEDVYITARWTDDKRSFNHIKDKVTWIPMDLNDLASCLKVVQQVKPDFIYHLGAQSSVPESFEYPAVTLQTNGIGTYNLLEAVRYTRDLTEAILDGMFEGRGPTDRIRNLMKFDPVIHVCSSSEVYGVVSEEDQPIKETQPFNPANPYAVSKVTEDMVALMFWTNFKIKTIRTRFFTHTGPRRVMMSAESYYAKAIAEIERGAKPYIPLGNMESIRTFADVRDAVKAYYLLARSEKYGDVFNIAGESVKSIQEVLDQLIKESKLNKEDIEFAVDPKLLRPYDVKKQTVDITKIKNTIDWTPEIPFEQTMSDLLNFWRKELSKNG